MKKIIGIILTLFAFSYTAEAQNSKIIFYYHKHRIGEAGHTNLHVKLPNNPIYSLMSGKKARNRTFYELNFNDTGTLFIYFFYGNNMLEINKPRFDSTIKASEFSIKKNTILWLDVTSADSVMYRLQRNLPVDFLTENAFAIKYKKAYRKYKKQGYKKVFDNIPLNIDEKPSKDEVKYVRKTKSFVL